MPGLILDVLPAVPAAADVDPFQMVPVARDGGNIELYAHNGAEEDPEVVKVGGRTYGVLLYGAFLQTSDGEVEFENTLAGPASTPWTAVGYNTTTGVLTFKWEPGGGLPDYVDPAFCRLLVPSLVYYDAAVGGLVRVVVPTVNPTVTAGVKLQWAVTFKKVSDGTASAELSPETPLPLLLLHRY